MPGLRNKATGQVSVVSDEQAADLIRSGRFEIADGGAVEVRGKTGAKVRVGQRQLDVDQSLTPTTTAEQAAAERHRRLDRQHGQGILNKAKAVGEGLVSGATFGLADPLLEDEATAFRRDNLGGYRFAGELGGMLIPGLLTGGTSLEAEGAVGGLGGLARATARYTPAGLAARGGAALAEGRGLIGAIGGAALEGAAGNAGYYLSDVALGNRDLSAEGFVGAMGEGALWGGAAGGGAHAIERGFVAARNMFPRLAGRTAKAAEIAEETFTREAGAMLDAGDDAVRTAREKLKRLRADRADANLGMARAREAGDLDAVKAAQQRLRGIKTQEAEARFTIETGKVPEPAPAKAAPPEAPAPPSAPAEPPAVPVAPGDVVAEAPTTWTPQAMGDSAELAEMLGQKPRFAEGSGEFKIPPEEQRLADLADRVETTRARVDDWVRNLRGNLAKKSGGTFTADIAPVGRGEMAARQALGEGHFLETRIGGSTFDDAGNIIAESLDDIRAGRGGLNRPDKSLIWDRPRLKDVDEAIAVREDYDDLIRQAALADDAGVRESLLREAADLEAQAFDAAPGEHTQRVLKARDIEGVDGYELARRRAQRYVDEHFETFGAAKPSKREMAKRRAERGGLVDDTEEAVKVIGDYERAHADLVKELGQDAPPAAKDVADKLEEAVAEQSRKVTDRTAQIADDAAGEAAASPAQKARAKGKKGRDGLADGVATPEEPQGLLGRVADIGSAIEVLQTVGLPGMPDLDQLPIIGPVLGLFLKARAARAMVGRLGGKVPATVEARAAKKASQVRDRIATSVDRMLGLGESAARRSKAVAGLVGARSATLAHRLYDDGDGRGDANDDATRTQHRMAELGAAVTNPNGVRLAVRKAMRGAHDPDLVRAVEEATLRKLSYLAEHMPKEPPPSLLGGKKWRPSKVEIDRFARRVKAAEDPASVFEDLADGSITPEAAETLREVYPQLYAEAQQRLIERAAEIEKEIPYQRAIKLAVLFDAPLVPSMRPERIAAYQEVAPQSAQAQPAPMPGQGGGAPPVNFDSLYATDAQRRALR